MGTICKRLERDAENIISADSILGSVPNSSQKNMHLFLSLPPFSSATESISRYNCWTIKEIIKNVAGFSSGMIINSADFSLQNFSASISVSKQRICSSSESRKEFSRESAVDITDAILCSAVLRAAPANHLALWSFGSNSINCWNWFFPFLWEGASSSWMILNTDTIWRSSGLQNSATNNIVAVSKPSAAS